MGFLRRLFFGTKKPRPDKDSSRRRWSFSRSSPNTSTTPPNDANKHAIAVAAATAAVAEAALAAAHAAAEVVRLTSSGPSHRIFAREMAALKIQSAFRAYLARRALRALKALVKLQALVRGHIVRKQTADMLRRMQTLVRLQARARASRAEPLNTSTKFSNSRYAVPASPEKDEYHFPAYSTKYDAPSILKRCGSNTNLRDITALDKAKMQGSNWLDRWMEDSSGIWNSSRDSSMRHAAAHVEDEKSDKILEVDTWKPRLNSQHSSRMLRTTGKSTRKMSPAKPQDQAAARTEDNSSPHIHSASSRQGSSSARRSPFTPTRSDCSRGYLNAYSSHPNYMAYTESSRAKFRSQSAPRQRFEMDQYRYGSMNRSLQGLWEAPSSNEREYSECRLRAYPAPDHLSRPGTPNPR